MTDDLIMENVLCVSVGSAFAIRRRLDLARTYYEKPVCALSAASWSLRPPSDFVSRLKVGWRLLPPKISPWRLFFTVPELMATGRPNDGNEIVAVRYQLVYSTPLYFEAILQ
jgi:hypothetical protein